MKKHENIQNHMKIKDLNWITRKFIIVLFIINSLLGFYVQGQTEDKKSIKKDSIQRTSSSPWNIEASVGFSSIEGNVNKLDLRADGTISRINNQFECVIGLKALYSTVEKVERNKELSGFVLIDLQPRATISPFMAISVYSNKYYGYDLRLSTYGGVKYVFLSKPNFSFSISGAVEFNRETYSPNSKGVTLPLQNILRLSLRPKIKLNLFKNTYIEHYTFYKPKLTDFTNYQIVSTTSISLKISQDFQLSLINEYLYESIPPFVEIKKSNMSYYITLGYKLGRAKKVATSTKPILGTKSKKE